MKRKIENSADIKHLVDTFYEKVIVDESIGFIFTDIIQLDWEVHMPIMYSFWESVLLSKPSYSGNPVLRHIKLNQKTPLTEAYFDKWLELWFSTLDENFEGDIASSAKEKATMMKELMLYKIKKSSDPNFIG